MEGFLTLAAAQKTTPQVVEATIQLARLAGWKIPVQELNVDGKPCGPILKPALPPKAVGKKAGKSKIPHERALLYIARELRDADVHFLAFADGRPINITDSSGKAVSKSSITTLMCKYNNIQAADAVRKRQVQLVNSRI